MNTLVRLVSPLAIGAALAGCAPPQTEKAVVIEDRVHAVSPSASAFKAGPLTGTLTDLKVIERVKQGTDRVDTPAKLNAQLKLENPSRDQTIRVIGGRLLFIDYRGEAIPLATGRTESTFTWSSSRSATERLDPGMNETQAIDVNFPVIALKDNNLKEIRVELTYIPSAFAQNTVGFKATVNVPAAAANADRPPSGQQ